jgi:Kef-type K+ transport system membrane component KefB
VRPLLIGEVLAGILVGPSLFGSGFSSAVFPADTKPFLTALGNVGVAMFVVELELERTPLRGRGRIAARVSLSSILLPFAGRATLATEWIGLCFLFGASCSAPYSPATARRPHRQIPQLTLRAGQAAGLVAQTPPDPYLNYLSKYGVARRGLSAIAY